MGHQLLLLDPHLHPYTGGVPPAHSGLLQVPQETSGPARGLRPPHSQPGSGPPPPLLPLPLGI